MTPLIIMVGANKGGVGKTTVARAVDDYLQARRAARRVFDSEWPAGDLRRFAPQSEIVDVEKVDDQMRVFDTVDGVTLLDVRAGLLSPTLAALDKVSLLRDVRDGKLALALLHVVGPTVSSLEEVSASAAVLGTGARHFLVKNYVNESGFFEWDADSRFADVFRKMEHATVTVPHLPARAAEEVQKRGGSFQEFSESRGTSRWLRGEVRSWLDATWQELDRVGLGGLVHEATGS